MPTLRFSLALLCVLGVSPVLPAEEIPSAMFRYVQRPEPDFKCTVKQHHKIGDSTVHQLHLVSQKWQGIVWEHALLVYEPQELVHPHHMLIMVTGGRTGGQPRPEDMLMGVGLANLCGARIATLHQVPNQPLFGDHVEDDLITETWLRYLETGDESWPLLFPMVKSAVQAMNGLEAFSKEQWNQELKGFVITGASKRGWTSWLTPVADKRVIGTAPIVIDTLNFPVQMKHQLDIWGEYSEQIADYTSKGLVKPDGVPRTMREDHLWKMMDPFTYREQLTLPKLIINGANDRYWVSDALKNYWDELQGPKHVLMVPNAGHNLGGGREGALTTLGVFFRHTAAGKELPQLKWELTRDGNNQQFTISATQPAQAARLWVAKSDNRDFRESAWQPVSLEGKAGEYRGTVTKPESGHVAMFGELQFEFDNLLYSLTSRTFLE